jgi:RNA polymerase-binding transcription factor DksA
LTTKVPEDVVKKSSRHMRQVILGKLYTHLEECYSISLSDNLSEGFPTEDRVSLNQIDAILAFKSDPQLDELHAAFERLEEGTFGLCLSCKKQIDDNLMDADPTRRMCARCERVYSHIVLKYADSAIPV